MAFLDIKKLSVLIVEDEPQILEQMKIALEDFTDVLFTAKNGEAALKILEEEKTNFHGCLRSIQPGHTGQQA